MSTERQISTAEFLARHPVFSTTEAAEAFPSPRGARSVVWRFRRYVEDGRLKRVGRGLYAVVPPGCPTELFQPDAFLVALAARPDAVFCYHSALELLGAAHSVWTRCTVFTAQRRPTIRLGFSQVEFLDAPRAMRAAEESALATRRVERGGKLLQATARERTLVEGFRRPDLVGGLAELVASASGFPTLDLDLLERVLEKYNERRVWAAAGWFLERHQSTFHVPEEFLRKLEGRRPRSPLYVPRQQRGGVLSARWNLVLPVELMQSEPDER